MATPVIIPVFLPHLGCPEHCIFCNQRALAPEVPLPSRVRELIETSLHHLPADPGRLKQVAFYGGSFTAIPEEDQIAYLKEVEPFLSSGRIDSIRISTRPDALDEKVLFLLARQGVKTIEVGAQSMVDEVLCLSCRGHSADETSAGIGRLKSLGFEAGVHLMIGLPGDSLERFEETLNRIIDLRPHFVRIHPTLVLRGAVLEQRWREGRYCPLTLAEAVQWLKRGLLRLEKASIPVVRVGLQPTGDLEASYLSGPYHPALHQRVVSEIYFDMAARVLEPQQAQPEIIFLCHPGEVSNVRGQKNENIRRLKEVFALKSIMVQGKRDIHRGRLVIKTAAGEFSIERGDLFE